MTTFNEKGLLNPGFFEYKLNEIQTIFVDEFKESQTRKRNFNGFYSWLSELLNICIPNEIWIDGSFVTNKTNPNDIDIVAFLEYQDYVGIFERVDCLKKLGKENFCDIYISISPNDMISGNWKLINNRNYWRGQFGFDREDNPKGMIKMSKEYLSLVKEGIKDVK